MAIGVSPCTTKEDFKMTAKLSALEGIRAFHTTNGLSFNHIIHYGKIVPCRELPDFDSAWDNDENYSFFSLFRPSPAWMKHMGDRGFVFSAVNLIARGAEIIRDPFQIDEGTGLGHNVDLDNPDAIYGTDASIALLGELVNSHETVQNTYQLRCPCPIELYDAFGKYGADGVVKPFKLEDYPFRLRELISCWATEELLDDESVARYRAVLAEHEPYQDEHGRWVYP